jgi:NitT/TauT family transport system substrate-binding protein
MGRLSAAAVPLALALAAAGPAFGGEPAPPRERPGLRLGIRAFLSDVPAMLADRRGYFAREGASVETILSPQGRDSGRLLASGSLDLAVLGNHIGPEALSRAPQDDPLVVLACLGGGGERWRVMSSSSGPASLEELRGKRLGAWPSSYGYRLLDRLLREKGIRPELVRVPMAPDAAAAALEKGEVDALLAWEPIPSLLEDRMRAREIFNLSGLGEGVPVYLVARKSAVRGSPAETAGVLRALARATADVNEHPDRAAEAAAPLLDVPAPVLRKALAKSEFRLSLTCRQRKALEEAAGGARIEFDARPLRAALGAGGAVEEGCGEEESRAPGALRVGYFLGGRTSMLMRIQEAGGFRAEGLDVELLSKSLRGTEFAPVTRAALEKRDFPSKATGGELLEGLLRGSWDLATVGESSFLAAVAGGKPVVAVARLGSDRGDESGHLFAVRKGLRLASPKDYLGKLLVSRRAGLGDEAFLREYLARAGVDLDRDVLALPKLPASAAERRALPRDKVLLADQVYEDDLKKGVRDGLIDGGFFHLMAYEKLKDSLDEVEALQKWTAADSSVALLVARREFLAAPEGRAKTAALIRALVVRARLENGMTPEQRRAQASSDEAVQRWRGLESSTPGASYPRYSDDPRVEIEPLAAMAALLRRHKLVDWPELDIAAHVDNGAAEQALRETGGAQ